jgi:hypothetical protein
MMAAAIAIQADIRKKPTLLVGNPARIVSGLFSGRSLVYFHQFTSTNGIAQIAAAKAQ